MVDNILASYYLSVNHDMSHLTMTPLRWFPEFIQWIFGEEDGFSTFIWISEQLGKWILVDGQLW